MTRAAVSALLISVWSGIYGLPYAKEFTYIYWASCTLLPSPYMQDTSQPPLKLNKDHKKDDIRITDDKVLVTSVVEEKLNDSLDLKPSFQNTAIDGI